MQIYADELFNFIGILYVIFRFVVRFGRVQNIMDGAFKKFASKANGTEASSMDINKWAKDAGVLGKNLTSNHIDIAFSKVKVKGAKYV